MTQKQTAFLSSNSLLLFLQHVRFSSASSGWTEISKNFFLRQPAALIFTSPNITLPLLRITLQGIIHWTGAIVNRGKNSVNLMTQYEQT